MVKSSTIHSQANNDWVNIGVACVRDIGISYSHCCYCFDGFLVQSLIDIYIFLLILQVQNLLQQMVSYCIELMFNKYPAITNKKFVAAIKVPTNV